MFKTLLKIGLVFVAAAILGTGIGRCSKDFGTVKAAETSDWKKCETKVLMMNTSDMQLTYNVDWLDHDIEQYKGRAIPRCGGGLDSHDTATFSKNFRLCPGRHIVTWYPQRNAKMISRYTFFLEPGVERVIITPKSAIKEYAIKGPKLDQIAGSAISDIQEGLVKEEAIKKAIFIHFRAFIKIAKVRDHGHSGTWYVILKDNNVIYTMSVNGNAMGILSISFTKQVTISKDVVDIYYEGVRNGSYYCYAQQLPGAENYKQVPIPKKSIFEQIVVMMFNKGETA